MLRVGMLNLASQRRKSGTNYTEKVKRRLRVATHDVGIFIGVLFAADKLVEIGSRFPGDLGPLYTKLYKIGSQSPFELIALIIAFIIAAIFFAYLIIRRGRDWWLIN
jgi:hypothetical protein